MRFQLLSVALLAAVLSTIQAVTGDPATSDLIPYGICTCFAPEFDASCCMYAKGYMQNDGNVCETPYAGIEAYKTCCTRSKGKEIKCKTGYRDPKNPWPPADTYGCST
ncbi:hypothetical protein CPC16_000694 [Podila verticillata]|nr:hypothetical protein CPC16_000694 [Podila verticillata]